MKNEGSFNRKLGSFGEGLVVDYLKNSQFNIIAQNFQKRGGEVDIIAKKDDILSFVEVKLRQNTYFNNSEVIVKSKMRKIITTAKLFLAENSFIDYVIRFDVAIIEKVNGKYQINYIENAFNGD